MDIKDWMAPMVTLAIGASTIFISYKNYQSQTQAKPSELARLELWSKLLAEAGIDIGDLPPEDELTAEQREILENYRVFLKRASLESKLRKVGIENNRLFNLLMKRAHSPVKPTPIGFGDSIIYYRLILWLFAFIWIPIATIFLGIPVLISFGAYLYRMFITRSADNYVDYSIPVGSLVIIIIGLLAVGGLWYLQNKIRSAIIANNVYFYFWDTYGAKRGSRDSVQAYTERLTAKTYSDLLFIGQHEFAQQFRENMYMAGIQEIDEYPRVLSDVGMIPRNHQVVEATADYNWLDRIINWMRAKIGMEPKPARVIYTLERKPPKGAGATATSGLDVQLHELKPGKKKRFRRKRKKGRVLMQAEPATDAVPLYTEHPDDAASDASEADSVAASQPQVVNGPTLTDELVEDLSTGQIPLVQVRREQGQKKSSQNAGSGDAGSAETYGIDGAAEGVRADSPKSSSDGSSE